MTDPNKPKLILPFGIQVNDYGRTEAAADEAKFWAWMFEHITKAVEASFLKANMTNPPLSEMKQRTDMATDLVKQLRKEKKWSKFKIRDLLPTILTDRLINGNVNLDLYDDGGKRTGW